jgi:hypothetical protein
MFYRTDQEVECVVFTLCGAFSVRQILANRQGSGIVADLKVIEGGKPLKEISWVNGVSPNALRAWRDIDHGNRLQELRDHIFNLESMGQSALDAVTRAGQKRGLKGLGPTFFAVEKLGRTIREFRRKYCRMMESVS